MTSPLAPARGIVIGLILGLILWAVVFALVFGDSVMHELGRRAVEQGVIP